jgi:hypothetical protein
MQVDGSLAPHRSLGRLVELAALGISIRVTALADAKVGGEAARPVCESPQSLRDADADPPVPLNDEAASALAGRYVFGVGASHNKLTLSSSAPSSHDAYVQPAEARARWAARSFIVATTCFILRAPRRSVFDLPRTRKAWS